MKNAFRYSMLSLALTVITGCGMDLIQDNTIAAPGNSLHYTTGTSQDAQGRQIVFGARQTFAGMDNEGNPIVGFAPYIAALAANGETQWETVLPTSHERTQSRSNELSGDYFLGGFQPESNRGEEVRFAVTTTDAIYVLARAIGDTFNQVPLRQRDRYRDLNDWDTVLYKLDNQGNVAWQHVVQQSEQDESPSALKLLPNGSVAVLVQQTEVSVLASQAAIVSVIDSNGNEQWHYQVTGPSSALGVGDSSLLLSYGGFGRSLDGSIHEPLAPNAVQLDFQGDVDWAYTNPEYLTAATIAQPRCSGPVGSTKSTVFDIAHTNGAWVVAASRNSLLDNCNYLQGVTNASLFWFNNGQITKTTPIKGSPFSEQFADYLSGNLEAVGALRFFNVETQGMKLAPSPNGIYLVTHSHIQTPIFIEADYENTSYASEELQIDFIDNDGDVAWTRNLRGTSNKADDKASMAYHRAVDAQADGDDNLILYSQVIKANYTLTSRYDGSVYPFGKPELGDIYSRVHKFTPSGTKSTLITQSGQLGRGFAINADTFTLISDRATQLANDNDGTYKVDFSLLDPLLDQSSYSASQYR